MHVWVQNVCRDSILVESDCHVMEMRPGDRNHSKGVVNTSGCLVEPGNG